MIPGNRSTMEFDQSLEEWAKDKPLSILQLDPADRAVLRIAGKNDFYWLYLRFFCLTSNFPHPKLHTYTQALNFLSLHIYICGQILFACKWYIAHIAYDVRT